MHRAPRCTARAKRTGLPCSNPAVRGWNVYRMHGARAALGRERQTQPIDTGAGRAR